MHDERCGGIRTGALPPHGGHRRKRWLKGEAPRVETDGKEQTKREVSAQAQGKRDTESGDGGAKKEASTQGPPEDEGSYERST